MLNLIPVVERYSPYAISTALPSAKKAVKNIFPINMITVIACPPCYIFLLMDILNMLEMFN